MRHTARWLVWVIVGLLFLSTAVASAQSAPPDRIVVLETSSSFPEMSITVRAFDQDGKALRALSPSDVDVYENGELVQDVRVRANEAAPTNVIFVLDFGQFSNYGVYDVEELREALRYYATGDFFRDGVDRVTILGRLNNGVDETIEILSPTRSVEEFVASVDQIRFSRSTGSTQSLIAVEEARGRLLTQVEQPEQAGTAIVFMAHSVHLPPTSQQAAAAQQIGIVAREQLTQIYSLHANREGSLDQPFRVLAAETGGQYFRIIPDQSNIEIYDRMYRDIANLGQSYTLSFTSLLGDSGTREIAVVPSGRPLAEASAIGRTNVNLGQPEITITAYEREVMREPAAGNTLEPDSTTVTAEISDWPYDLQAGDLESAELLIEGRESIFIPNPDPAELTFPINIDTITTSENLNVQVRVVDNKNIVGLSQVATINVIVDTVLVGSPCEVDPNSNECRQEQLAAQATAEAVAAISEERAIAEEERLRAEAQRDAAEAERASAEQLTQIVSIASGTIILILLVLLIIFRRQLSQRVTDARTVLQTGGSFVDAAKTMIVGGTRGQNPMARLRVVAGPNDLISQTVNVYSNTTTIGRDSALSDILFYEGQSNSTISGEHCTIQFDLGQFLITDNNSSNGTFVNGNQLRANEPYKLFDGDEITLGDLFRRGVKLTLEIVELPPTEEEEGLVDDLETDWGLEDEEAISWEDELLEEPLNGELEGLDLLEDPLEISWDDGEPLREDRGAESAPTTKRKSDDNWMDELE